MSDEDDVAAEGGEEITEADWITGPVKALVAVGATGGKRVIGHIASKDEWPEDKFDEGEGPRYLHELEINPGFTPRNDHEWLEWCALDGGDFFFGCDKGPGIWLYTVRFYDAGNTDWDYLNLEEPQEVTWLMGPLILMDE